MAVKFIIDTCCDLNIQQAEAMGITLIPMVIRFGTEEYRSGLDISNEEFYQKLATCQDNPTTSQPAPFVFEQAYEKIVQDGDEAVVLCVSSSLSGTYQSATIAADGYEDRIYVVDTKSVSLGEKILLDYAMILKDRGFCAKEIAAELEHKKQDVRIYGAVETLEYLIRGGRLSKAAGAVGSVLGIRPVLCMTDGTLGVAGKARGPKAAIAMTHKLITQAGVDMSLPCAIGYTGSDASTPEPFLQSQDSVWYGTEAPLYNIGSTVGTHTGPGLYLAAFFCKS